MKKALRKVTGAGKALKGEVDYTEESGTSETESDIEDELMDEERTSRPWETIIRDKR